MAWAGGFITSGRLEVYYKRASGRSSVAWFSRRNRRAAHGQRAPYHTFLRAAPAFIRPPLYARNIFFAASRNKRGSWRAARLRAPLHHRRNRWRNSRRTRRIWLLPKTLRCC